MKKTLSIYLPTLFAAAGLAYAAPINVDPNIDFDVSTDFTSNFTNNGSAAYAWSATAGIGGTGGVTSTVGDGAFTAEYNPGAAFGVGSLQSISAIFLFASNGQSNAATNNRFSVGTVNSGGDSGEFRGVAFQMFGGAATDQWTPRLRVRANTVSTGEASLSLTDNHWYRMDASFTITNVGGDFTYSYALYDYGTAGTSLSSTLFSLENVSVIGQSLDSANNRYLSFVGTEDANGFGIQAIDNFGTVAVPEPSTFALLGGGLATLAFLRRRRRN